MSLRPKRGLERSSRALSKPLRRCPRPLSEAVVCIEPALILRVAATNLWQQRLTAIALEMSLASEAAESLRNARIPSCKGTAAEKSWSA
ncbi:hypothetical protein HPB50_015315 [Hyalomma asiaticum]|uniref:Uncharacterized protein n=1 Tax=Hyalomma asiaticum TaxID=266040 RepID=A0ACB7TL19_HYAAI|nr:hypothetical protein HPB50_015315 [Hyalomma asiaticum]